MSKNGSPVVIEEGFEEDYFAELLSKYRGQKGALIPLLQGAQEIFGYLPQSVMERVAEAAGEPVSRALGVATFYAQFRLEPRAKHMVRCCHGTACHVSGAPLITQEVTKYLGIQPGENTPDMMFTVEMVHCVGACGMAPVVMINDRAYGKLTPDKAVKVVKDFKAAHGLEAGDDAAETEAADGEA